MLWPAIAYVGVLVGVVGFVVCVVLAARLDAYVKREQRYLASRRELVWREDIG